MKLAILSLLATLVSTAVAHQSPIFRHLTKDPADILLLNLISGDPEPGCKAEARLILDRAQFFGDFAWFARRTFNHCQKVSSGVTYYYNPIDVDDLGCGVYRYRSALMVDSRWTTNIEITDYRDQTCGPRAAHVVHVEEHPLDQYGSVIPGATPLIWEGDPEPGPGGSGAHAIITH